MVDDHPARGQPGVPTDELAVLDEKYSPVPLWVSNFQSTPLALSPSRYAVGLVAADGSGAPLTAPTTGVGVTQPW